LFEKPNNCRVYVLPESVLAGMICVNPFTTCAVILHKTSLEELVAPGLFSPELIKY
jgi:hypothetical protein